MRVDSKHPDYDTFLPLWERARDFSGGEKRVKKNAHKYVPRLDGQTDEQYNSYIGRGKFLNATGRTLEGMVGLVFSKDPDVELPDDIEKTEGDADLSGNSLYTYTRTVVRDVMTTGRGGTLTDWNEKEARPYLTYYRTENIWNWQTRRVLWDDGKNGRTMLSLVVLKECTEEINTEATEVGKSSKDVEYSEKEVDRLRVLRLIGDGDALRYIIEIWEKVSTTEKTVEWSLVETIEPKRNGKALQEIPFVFHGSDRDQMQVIKPPLDDLISLNETHFKTACDFYHGLHFTALPTPWAVGFDIAKLTLGSTMVWGTDNPQAKCGYLEFTGQGLVALSTELKDTVNEMAVIGARILETQKKAAETAETMQIRQAGDSAVLTGICGSLSESITKALQWAEWWTKATIKAPSEIDEESLSVEVNTDFAMAKLTGADLTALVASYIQGAISFSTFFFNLQQGQVIPADRTEEQERNLIATQGPPAIPLNDDEETPPENPPGKPANPPAE